jgi:hypothetical protein
MKAIKTVAVIMAITTEDVQSRVGKWVDRRAGITF